MIRADDPHRGERASIRGLRMSYATAGAGAPIGLAASDAPKLFIRADPGMMVAGALAERVRGVPNTREVVVGGAHYVQEESPDEIGAAIARWIGELG